MVSRSSFYLLDDIWRFLQYEAENKGKGSLNGFSSIEWSLIENLGALIQAKAKNASAFVPLIIGIKLLYILGFSVSKNILHISHF